MSVLLTIGLPGWLPAGIKDVGLNCKCLRNLVPSDQFLSLWEKKRMEY